MPTPAPAANPAGLKSTASSSSWPTSTKLAISRSPTIVMRSSLRANATKLPPSDCDVDAHAFAAVDAGVVVSGKYDVAGQRQSSAGSGSASRKPRIDDVAPRYDRLNVGTESGAEGGEVLRLRLGAAHTSDGDDG